MWHDTGEESKERESRDMVEGKRQEERRKREESGERRLREERD